MQPALVQSRADRLWKWPLAFIGIALVALFYFHEIYALQEVPLANDFSKFYLSAERLIRGEPIYWPVLAGRNLGDPCYQPPVSEWEDGWAPIPPTFEERQACLHSNVNPPVFSILILPLSLLPYETAWWLFSIGSILAGILSVSLICHSGVLPNLRPLVNAALVNVLFFAYFPTFANTSYGQFALYLMLPLTLGWLALRNDQLIKGGIWIGIAASLKPFVALFLIIFILNRNWRAMLGFLTASALAFFLSIIITGPNSFVEYLDVLDGITWHAASWNASFAGFFYRLFGASNNTPLIQAATIAKFLTLFASLCVLVVVARMSFKGISGLQPLATDWQFAATIPAMLLLSPLGWMYYFPILLISFLILWSATDAYENPRPVRLMAVLPVIMTLFPTALISSGSTNTPKAWLWDAAIYFYALIIFFIVTLHGIATVIKKTSKK